MAPGPGCVAVVRGRGTAQFADRSCAQRIAAFESPHTLYRLLLGHPGFGRMLSLARSEYRMQDLATRAGGWAIDVYRVDPESADGCPRPES